MGFFRSKHSGHHPIDDEQPPSKRISTPAGQRLSIVLESTQSKRKAEPASKINVTTTSTYCNDPEHQHISHVHVHPAPETPRKSGFLSVLTGGRLGDTPRESLEEHRSNSSNLSVSVWSDTHTPVNEKFGHVRPESQRKRRWVWKKIALIVALLLVLIIAVAVGLAVGLKKKDVKRCAHTHLVCFQGNPTTDILNSSSPSATNGDSQPTGTHASSITDSDTPTKPVSTLTPSVAPSGFPLGTYSLVTFLDTVQTGCTSNNASWTCAPYTDYYSDPQKALSVINWDITGAPGAYKISSKDTSDLYMTFQNAPLDLIDEGKDTERYRFQISRTKSVNMTGTLGDLKGDFECDYGATNLQAYLYTKMQRSFPDDTIVVSDTGNPVWPYGEYPQLLS
jgi:hypothetical protein